MLRSILISAIGLLTLLAISCNSCGGGNGRSNPSSQTNANKDEGGPDLSIRMGKEDAIGKVQTYLQQQRGGSVTVQLPYTHSETVSRPCSQFDVDTDPNKGDQFLARCRPVGGGPGAPYGSKRVQEQKTECCRSQTVQWSTLRPVWTAEYLKDTDSWSVNMEFGVEEAKKSLNWIVDDKSGTVKERN